ncbi:MAG: Lacal_2735 family protein [Crocinitomicaceae bacterium]
MGLFTRKSKKEKLNDQYKKKLELAYKMSTSNRSESDRLTKEANDIIDEIKKIEEAEA